MRHTAAAPADPYHAIAALYDLEHDGFDDDIDLLMQLVAAVSGPFLEMGCGSGRVLAPLAGAGYRVVGLDRSPTMLDRARHRLTSGGLNRYVTLVEADMMDAASLPGEPFGMVAFTLNALMHVPSMDGQLGALSVAYRRLSPDGMVFVDVSNPAPGYLVDLAAAPAVEWAMDLGERGCVDKWAFRQVDSINQIIETILWYDETGINGVLRRIRTAFDLRYVHAAELTLMLRSAGFDNIHMFGGYVLDPLDDGSDRIIATATKRVPEEE